MTPTDAGTAFTLTAPTPDINVQHEVLQYVLTYHLKHGTGPSKNQLRKALGYSDDSRNRAIDALIAEHRINLTKDGNAHRLTPLGAD